ncbi:DUF2971 domain-containing protein [Hymenobacter sp. BT523]|uniref:DUF2971 domain-containing protein n=1 Tax=Hymenobacter sp. BT523 TaxID=2795725 RepID=UPI0018EBF1EE|nr:DUF2971 domain-containing protein [Hymenobacter sp. BT523]MBJ6111785.1 DUF2971 domain-containing protein [Hymenobacter sp. BT523]
MLNSKQLPKYLRYAYEDALAGGVDAQIVEAIFETAILHRSERDSWPHKRMTEDKLAALGTLYKYRDATNVRHWQILENQELWFPRPSTFNDPFDSRLLIRFDLMNPERMDAFLRAEIVRNEPGAGEHLIVAKMQDLKAALLNPVQHDQAARRWMAPLLDRTKILCLGRRKDNILMWSHYAQNHEGFAIGFDTVRLKNLCFELGGYLAGYVAYRDNYPILEFPEKDSKLTKKDVLTTLLNVKSRIWAYEKEVRITLFDAPDKSGFAADLISELVMGCNMTPSCEEKLLKIADTQYPDARVYKASMSRDAFSLEFNQVR